MNPRTAAREDCAEIEAIEWAALDDTSAAIRARDVSLRSGGLATLVDWDEYRRSAI